MNAPANVEPGSSADRTFVDEAEAYGLLARAGILPPRHVLVAPDARFEATVGVFAPGEPVVLKGLGEDLWHKSELGAVRGLPFDPEALAHECAGMRNRVEAAGHCWRGGLVCERIAIGRTEGLPTEAFVSLTRHEAGWIALCGVGGVQAEALAAVAPPLRWPLALLSPAAALAEWEAHLLGRIWLGEMRGTIALTTRAAVRAFIESLWQLADLAEAAGLTLLELNPVALDAEGRLRPLDAVGQRAPPMAPRIAPPPGFLDALVAPRRVALAGVSAHEGGVGRTILDNLRRCPGLKDHLVLVKPGATKMLGLPCVADVGALREAPVDLLILALPAAAAARTVTDLMAQGGGARVVGLVAGGLGDGADTDGLGLRLTGQLREARLAGRWTPAILGPNFLGHWVPDTGLDTSFIPAGKLAPPEAGGGALTLLSQSGAFVLCRRSRNPRLRLRLGVALGNQLDLALPDFLEALVGDPQCRAVAAYVEGFAPGHLAATVRSATALRDRGVPLLLHRAGRTVEGQAAAKTHTGALAGNLALESALLERAGVKFSASIAAFDAALAWLGAFQQRITGTMALLSNAGFEAVSGSDLVSVRLPAAVLAPAEVEAIRAMLEAENLTGLVTPRLPLDLTPMARESAFLRATEILLQSEAAVLVIGLVPFTRNLGTSEMPARAFAEALARQVGAHGKPVGVAVDAGPDYEAYRAAFATAGLPVFTRVEEALLGLATLE